MLIHPLSVLLLEVVWWWCSDVVCNCTLGLQALGPRLATICVLSRVTYRKLQGNLQMAATCAMFRAAQVKPDCEPKPAAANAKPGTT